MQILRRERLKSGEASTRAGDEAGAEAAPGNFNRRSPRDPHAPASTPKLEHVPSPGSVASARAVVRL